MLDVLATRAVLFMILSGLPSTSIVNWKINESRREKTNSVVFEQV